MQLLQRQAAARNGLGAEISAAKLSVLAFSVESMAGMVTELLDVARLQAGQALELQRQPTDLVALVRELVAAAQEQTDAMPCGLSSGCRSW